MDNKLNEVLAKQGLAVPQIKKGGLEENSTVKPLISETLYHGKGVSKGADYVGSVYKDLTEEMATLSEKKNDIKVDIMKNGLVEDAMKLVDYGQSKGVTFNLTSFNDARRALDDRAKYGDVEPTNPVELLVKYRQDIAAVTRPLEQKKHELLERLNETLVQPRKVTLEWLLKRTGASRDEVDEVSKLEYEKDITMAKYAALAETYNYQFEGATFAPAVLYAQLYIMNAKAEQRKRQDLATRLYNVATGQDATDSYQYLVEALVKNITFVKESYGVTPAGDSLKRICEVTVENNYSDSGFSSIQSLFPLGAVQFLQWIKTGAVQSTMQSAKYVVAYFSSDKPLTDEQKEQWANLFGQVEIKDGQLNGLSISAEDKLTLEEKSVSPSKKSLTNGNAMQSFENKPASIQEILLTQKFLRSGKFWAGGTKEAMVLHTVVYDKGVRVYLGGLRTVAAPSGIDTAPSAIEAFVPSDVDFVLEEGEDIASGSELGASDYDDHHPVEPSSPSGVPFEEDSVEVPTALGEEGPVLDDAYFVSLEQDLSWE